MKRYLKFPVALLALFVFTFATPAVPVSSADDWSLIKKDKKKGKKKVFSKKKKKKKKKEAGKKLVGEGADGKKLPGLFSKLLKDPTDDYLAQKYIEKIQSGELDVDEELGALSELAGEGKNQPNFRLALSHAYIMAGTIKKARGIFEALKSDLHDSASVYYLLALADIEEGKNEEAKGNLETALKKCHGGADGILESRIHDKLTSAALAAGDVALAAESFIHTAGHTGRLEDSFEMILSSLIAADKHDDAEAFLVGVIGAFPWSKYEKYYLYSTLAQLYHFSSKHKKAMEAAGKALNHYIPSLGECESAVDLYVGAAGELDKAEEAIGSILDKKPAPCIFVRCAYHMDDYSGTKAALGILEKGMKKFPGNETIIVSYAKALSKSGKVEQATAFLKAKVKKLSSPEIIIEFAKLVMESEGSAKVIKELEKISKASKQVWVHMALEEYFDSVGALSSAKKENEVLVVLDPKNPEHFIRLGERIFREGKIKEAKETWNKITGLYPSQYQGKLMLADIYFDHGMHSEAGHLYAALLKESNANIEVVKKLAMFYQATGKVKDAESWWQVVLTSDESDFHMKYEAALRLIQLWKTMGMLKKKEPEIKLLVERNPDDVLSKIMLAEVLFELNEIDRSEKIISGLFSSGVKESEVFAASMSIMEKVWKTKKKPSGYLKKLEEIIGIYPEKKTGMLLKIAQYSAQTADFDLTKKSLKEAIEMKPKDITLHEKAAALYMTIGDYKNAIKSLKLVVAADQYNFTRLIDLSEALINTGNEGESIKLLEKVVEQSTDQFLLDRAFSLLFTIKHSDTSQNLMEPYVYKLFKKSKNERLLKELIEIYSMMIDQMAGGAGGCKGQGPADEGEESAGQVQCGWIVRAVTLASSVIIEGPDSMRYEAAKIFQQIQTPQMAEKLLRKASNSSQPSAQLFAIAAASGANLPPEKTDDIFETFTKCDNKDVKSVSLVASSLLGLEDAGKNALLFFSDPEPNMRASAILAAGILLTKNPSDEVADRVKEETFKVLHERQFNMTYGAAILALGQAGGDGAFESLKNLYSRYYSGKKSKWGNKTTRITNKLILYAMAEGKLADSSVVPFLIKETWSPDEKVREAASYALYDLSCRRTGGVCGSMVKTYIPVAASMKNGKFQIIDLFEDWTAVPPYAFELKQIKFLSKYFDEVIGTEIEEFAAKKEITAVDFKQLSYLLSSMTSSQGEVAWEPVTSHVSSKDLKAASELIQAIYGKRVDSLDKVLLECRHSNLNTAASLVKPLIIFISQIENDKVPQVIIQIATSSTDSQEGLVAIKALGNFNNVEAVDALRKAAESSNWVARIAIVDSLKKIKSKEACDLLKNIYDKDASTPVREMAKDALGICH